MSNPSTDHDLGTGPLTGDECWNRWFCSEFELAFLYVNFHQSTWTLESLRRVYDKLASAISLADIREFNRIVGNYDLTSDDVFRAEVIDVSWIDRFHDKYEMLRAVQNRGLTHWTTEELESFDSRKGLYRSARRQGVIE